MNHFAVVTGKEGHSQEMEDLTSGMMIKGNEFRCF